MPRGSPARPPRSPPGGCRAGRIDRWSRRRSGVVASTTIPSQPLDRTVAAYRWPAPARRSGTSSAAQRSRMGRRPRPLAPVTAGVATLHDRRLLAADRREGASEVPLVIVLDVGHHRHAEVEHVGRVEPAPHADLNHGQVDPLSRELANRGGGERLELGGRAETLGHLVDRGQHRGDRVGKALCRERRSIDRDPLAVADEMRLRHRPHPRAGRLQHRAHHGDHATLAIRPGHQRPAQAALRVVERVHQRLDALETEAHAEAAARGERIDRRRVVEPGTAQSWLSS